MSNSKAKKYHSNHDLWNPPGGILIWLFVLAELLFFGVAFAMLARFRHNSAVEFFEQQSHLNIKVGIFLTLALVASGWQFAEFSNSYFRRELKSAQRHFFLGFGFGLTFLIIKALDFFHKFNEGLLLGKNDFWDFYWLYTGFHFLHLLLGLMILSFVYFKWRKNEIEDNDFAIRGSTCFWHMCDVIWLFMFPLFFLGKGT